MKLPGFDLNLDGRIGPLEHQLWLRSTQKSSNYPRSMDHNIPENDEDDEGLSENDSDWVNKVVSLFDEAVELYRAELDKHLQELEDLSDCISELRQQLRPLETSLLVHDLHRPDNNDPLYSAWNDYRKALVECIIQLEIKIALKEQEYDILLFLGHIIHKIRLALCSFK